MERRRRLRGERSKLRIPERGKKIQATLENNVIDTEEKYEDSSNKRKLGTGGGRRKTGSELIYQRRKK